MIPVDSGWLAETWFLHGPANCLFVLLLFSFILLVLLALLFVGVVGVVGVVGICLFF